MSEPTPIDLPVGLRWVKLVCRLGRLVTDSVADVDAHPDLLPVGGTLTLTASPSRVRIQEADGRWRSVEVAGRTYTIRADGELVDNEGRVGVYIPDPSSLLVEPQGYAITAAVKPTAGTEWRVTVGGSTVLPDVVDLVAMSSVGSVSPSVTASFDARLYALETGGGVDVSQAVEDYLVANPPAAGLDTEAAQDVVGAMIVGAGGTYDDNAGTITLPSSGGGGGYPVQHLNLTTSQVLDPTGWPTDQIVTAYFTQDSTGGWLLTLPSTIVTAYNVGWGPSTEPGSETVAQFRYSNGLAKWVCEASWVSIPGGVPTDATAPTVGTMGTSATNTSLTLTVTGAADETALDPAPYSFTTDGGGTWSAWQASNVYTIGGLAVSTGYPCNWRVRDAAGNVSTGTQATVTTSATADTTAPVWSATVTLGTPTPTKVIATASAQATDDVGVDHYEVSYDGGTTWATIPMLGGWTFELDGDPGITYSTTQLRAVDAAGNGSAPAVTVPTYTMAAEGTVLASDTFNRADQTGLGTADTGQVWAVLPGSTNTSLPNIAGNRAAKTWSGNPECKAFVDVGRADHSISVEMVGNYSANFSLIVRAADKNNYYSIGSDRKWMRTVAGTQVAVLGAFAATYPVGVPITVSAKEEEGTRLKVYFDGVEQQSFLDTATTRPQGTHVGFSPGFSGTLPLAVDNFEARSV